MKMGYIAFLLSFLFRYSTDMLHTIFQVLCLLYYYERYEVCEQNRIFMDSVLKFVSFNVNGLNEPIKRKRVLTYLKKLQVDITFLQETHLMGRAGSIVIIQFKGQRSGHFDK